MCPAFRAKQPEPQFGASPRHFLEKTLLNLLVVSHACATPINQSFFADVEAVTGWNVSLVLPEVWKTEYGDRNAEQWPAFRGGFHPVPVWNSGNIPLHVYRSFFAHLIRSVRPDAIYVQHEPYGAATAQVYLANRFNRHVPIGFYAAQNIFKKYPLPFRWTEKMVLSDSSFCFPVTGEALEVLRAKGYQGDAEVLPLAVDSALYRPMPDAALQLRQRLGIGESEPVIGYLGRLVPEKGLLTLVEALKRIEALAWRCVLVGNGPLEPQLRSALTDAGLAHRVLFPGYVAHTEAPVWLSMFDMLTLPSETQANWKEQFGRVIVEANACETPVIGTTCGEIPAIIRHTGGGVIVAEAAPEEFAAALRSLIHNPSLGAELARRGAVAVRREYDQHFLASRFASAVARHVTSRSIS
jgi:glycosyltransferase involved in cell wall biosynthesis